MLIHIMDLLEAEVDKETAYQDLPREKLIDIIHDLEKWCTQYRERLSTVERERDRLIEKAIDALAAAFTETFAVERCAGCMTYHCMREISEKFVSILSQNKTANGGRDEC